MRAFHHQYTWEDYLRLDRDSPIKLEFFRGEIFAMAGGTPQHSALAAKATVELGRQLEGKPCRPYNSDLRVRVPETGLGTYPDVTVICGKLEVDPEDKNTAVNPTVLVEVLSDSTDAYDRNEKFENYRRIGSLQEYVLISHRERLIEMFRRTEGDNWLRTEARTRGAVRLESLGCELETDRLYEGIELHNAG